MASTFRCAIAVTGPASVDDVTRSATASGRHAATAAIDSGRSLGSGCSILSMRGRNCASIAEVRHGTALFDDFELAAAHVDRLARRHSASTSPRL